MMYAVGNTSVYFRLKKRQAMKIHITIYACMLEGREKMAETEREMERLREE